MKTKTQIIATVLVALMFTCGAYAKTKVIEKSAKKVPEWVYDPGEGYMLVTVDAPSLSKAQDLAMEMLTERIIESVATNVSTSTVSEISHTSSNGEISEQETFNRSARLRSANLPFLKGISHTKIQGVYWAKVRDENSKREWIEYSIRYPFSKADLR
ncbi:MAG: hypothetical protein K2O88_03895 [Paramuribaculum sp.]|nr:hypothetical protein [Paramuribaculum sp.]